MHLSFPKIDRNIIALGFVSFFTDLASSMITPLIPILIVHILGNDIQVMSQVIAIATFVSYSLRVLFGYLDDKYQLSKLFIVIGYGISALIKPFYYFSNGWQDVAILQSSERLGKAFRSASKDNIIAYYSDKNKTGKSFGFHKMMDVAGELFGATIVFLVLIYIGDSELVIRNIFSFTIIPGLIALLIVIFYVKKAPCKKKKSHYRWLKNDYSLFPILLIFFLFTFFIFSHSFYVIKATSVGYSFAMIPLLFIVLSMTQTATSYYFGLRIDQFGAVRMLTTSFCFGIVSILLFLIDSIFLSFIFLGLFTVCSQNAIKSYISENTDNRSTIFGLLYAGIAFSGALGALLTGYLWNTYGLNYAVLVSLVGCVSALIGLSMMRSQPN